MEVGELPLAPVSLVNVPSLVISVTLPLPEFATQALPLVSRATLEGESRPPPVYSVPVAPEGLSFTTELPEFATHALPLESIASETGVAIEPAVNPVDPDCATPKLFSFVTLLLPLLSTHTFPVASTATCPGAERPPPTCVMISARSVDAGVCWGWNGAVAVANIMLEARLVERTRIARDLHDTLLQSFHGLMFRFQAARSLRDVTMILILRAADSAGPNSPHFRKMTPRYAQDIGRL